MEAGRVRFTGHALDKLAADGLKVEDAIRVIRGGTFEPAELERGTWRYRARAATVYVVVSFRGEEQVIVVTAWRRR